MAKPGSTEKTRQAFTMERIAKLEGPAPGGRQKFHFDPKQPGLGVRVSESGGRSYVAQYTLAARKYRMPLGSFDGISLDDARKAVKTILGAVARGENPAMRRAAETHAARLKAQEDALTLDHLIARWGEGRKLVGKRPSYVKEASRSIRVAFSKQLTRPATELDRDAVKNVVIALNKADKPMAAARARAYGAAIFHWAIKEDLLLANPFENQTVAKTVTRNRTLSEDELLSIWKATDEAGSFNSIVRLLVMLGQRREEVAGLVWGELSADLTKWTLPRSRAKNGQEHVVPIPPQARRIIETQTGERKPDALVFPGHFGVFCGWSKSKIRLDKDSGVELWTIHDLRRTCATGLHALGVRLEVAEAILNHKGASKTGVAGVYNKHEYFVEKTLALAAWGEHLSAIVEGRASEGNVTPIRRGHAA